MLSWNPQTGFACIWPWAVKVLQDVVQTHVDCIIHWPVSWVGKQQWVQQLSYDILQLYHQLLKELYDHICQSDRPIVIQSCDGGFLGDQDAFEAGRNLTQFQGSVEDLHDDWNQWISTGFKTGGGDSAWTRCCPGFLGCSEWVRGENLWWGCKRSGYFFTLQVTKYSVTLVEMAISHVVQSCLAWIYFSVISLLVMGYLIIHLVGSMQYIQEKVKLWYSLPLLCLKLFSVLSWMAISVKVHYCHFLSWSVKCLKLALTLLGNRRHVQLSNDLALSPVEKKAAFLDGSLVKASTNWHLPKTSAMFRFVERRNQIFFCQWVSGLLVEGTIPTSVGIPAWPDKIVLAWLWTVICYYCLCRRSWLAYTSSQKLM